MTKTTGAAARPWTDVLTIRDEVRSTDGSVGELQMSLAKAVYQTVPVPYAKCEYYTDITEPTPKLVGFLGRVARRLGVRGVDATACFHLDQGMGGGKSHALVGLWHMVSSQSQFFASSLGREVLDAAGQSRHDVDLSNVLPVVLTCDAFSPGKTDATFGPATDLYGRFLWSLFAGNPNRADRFKYYVDRGSNKAALQEAFAEVARPVLVLIDELMDYAMALTDQTQIGGIPGEEAFLNALTDAVDDQPNVALVIVMIRSDEDEAGYHPAAEGLREYLGPRLQRNGETVAVTESADFAQIIRKRLFENCSYEDDARALGEQLAASVRGTTWIPEVFEKLGTGRDLASLASRVVDTYPFHPDLFSLAAKEWTVVQAFQRVRSTVKIFARTALYWSQEAQAGRWAPELIGVGDIPLGTEAVESLLSSGVLAGNDRAIQGYRAVAAGDVIDSTGGGNASAVDKRLAEAGVTAGQPAPAVRMATACFAYSLVARARGKRGATKPELMAALLGTSTPFSDCEEVFNALVAGPGEGGLRALERTTKVKGEDRFYLTIKQTLNMYHGNAIGMVSNEMALNRVWEVAQKLANKGTFDVLKFVEPAAQGELAEWFKDLDSTENKLVVLDPRQWTLGNGKDRSTRTDLEVVFGVRPGRTATYAASVVVACAATPRRDKARNSARVYLAWEHVVSQLQVEDDEFSDAVARRDEAKLKLDADVRQMFEHFAYVSRKQDGLVVEYKSVGEKETSLSGASVWAALVSGNRASSTTGLNSAFVAALLDTFDRSLTPKELFQQPYGNPSWPLIANQEQLKQAVFELVTRDGWALEDSDDNEIVVTSAGQVQTASMSQRLRRRLASIPTGSQASSHSGATGADDDSGVDTSTCGANTGTPTSMSTPGTEAPTSVEYEKTTVTIPYGSLTDPDVRSKIWVVLRELSKLVDPSNVGRSAPEMIGVQIQLSGTAGATGSLVDKAAELPSVKTSIEADL